MRRDSSYDRKMDKRGSFPMKMTSYAEGDGLLFLATGRQNSVHYSIGIWRTPDGEIFGKGYMSGAVEAMCAAACHSRPLPLRLHGGNAVDVLVTERGAGK